MGKSVKVIREVVKGFLDQYWDQKSPLLVAYSGGPDSKALLYSLLSMGKMPLHVAHVDHGWRSESAEEALLLKREVEALGLPFHTKRLLKKTTEDEAREARFSFFRELSLAVPFQAVLLGHHGDDLAETALKRVFEGASLTHLFGLLPVRVISGLSLFRPFLSVSRAFIEEYLTEEKLTPLRDPSNADPRYLRARMRTALLPSLEKIFGKNMRENIICLSERSRELCDYLRERVAEHSLKITRGPSGPSIDGSGIPRIELRFLVSEVAKEEGLILKRDVLETVLDWIFSEKPKRSIFQNGREMVVDRGYFFLLAAKKSLASKR
jgi:tRNA(Ile)-lysidine synthase